MQSTMTAFYLQEEYNLDDHHHDNLLSIFVCQRVRYIDSPVVRCAGLVNLHQAIVFISWVVRGKDVHLVPFL